MIPLHPDVVELFTEWTATNANTSARAAGSSPTTTPRSIVAPCTASSPASATIAGIDDMHPHRLRHTLATQAINRGMRLEAIAALLGHRSLEMTLVYAKITDRVVADEYASVCEQIDALYNTAATPGALPAEIETAAMTRLRQESHARMLGNGMCTRPVELDCRMETICETCAYFETGPEFVPVLLRQRDHARTHHQTDRARLYDTLITRAEARLALTPILRITPARGDDRSLTATTQPTAPEPAICTPPTRQPTAGRRRCRTILTPASIALDSDSLASLSANDLREREGQRTGTEDHPRTVEVCKRVARSASTSQVGGGSAPLRARSRPSSRASAAPRQKWMPYPNETCLSKPRWMSNLSASG